MSVLLYVVGATAVMVGVGMVAFGIPINEFSFGNTLIGAGITAATGGLIILSLGVVAGQLHKLADAIAARPPARPGRALDAAEAPAEPPVAAAPSPRAATPPARPKSAEPPARDPFEHRPAPSAPLGTDEPASASFAPSLRNPEAPPLAVDDDVSLSPDTPRAGGRHPLPPGANGGMSEHGHPFQQAWRGSPRDVSPPNFDTMWPAESRPSRGPASEPPAVRSEGVPREPMPPLPPSREPAPSSPGLREPAPPLPGAESPPTPPRAVAVLKSGVVDGMGYTLYVDGSIEAELPQGTLRFASIEELRTHLEKNS